MRAGGPESRRDAISRFTRLRRPIQRIVAGDTLRILDEDRFAVTWSADGWKTVNTTPSRSLGSAGHSADISTATESSRTVNYHGLSNGPEQGRWLGYNVNVKIEAG